MALRRWSNRWPNRSAIDRTATVSAPVAFTMNGEVMLPADRATVWQKLNDPEVRDRGEDLSRLAEDALRAERVARVVVRD